MMDILNTKPDSESHHMITFNEQPLQITFRYFSPSKCHMEPALKNSIDHVTQSIVPSSGRSAHSSAIANEGKEDQNSKIYHDPQRDSNKFYESNLLEIQHSTLGYYEQFQGKLLHKNIMQQNHQKIIKIKLTRNKNTQNIVSINKQNDHKKKLAKRMNVYLMKPQIQKKVQQQPQRRSIQKSYNRKPIFQRTSKSIQSRQISSDQRNPARTKVSPKKKLQIKLYQQKKNVQNQTFVTPRKRNSENKKGIVVYSSSSTKRQTDGELQTYVKTHNKTCSTTNQNIDLKTHQNGKLYQNETKNHKSLIRLRSIKLSDEKNDKNKAKTNKKSSSHLQNMRSSQIKRRIEQTKKRVFSKSTLSRKSNPVYRKIVCSTQ